MMNNERIEFYKNTSPYTELGPYKDFAKSLPNDITELCYLLRMQIIHPSAFKKEEIRNSKNCFWGNMTEISEKALIREDDILPTAIGMLAELLRKNANFKVNRQAKDKIFVTCRGIAILLTAILKTKGIPARVRSGFAEYPSNDGVYWDHWITEYYNFDKKNWILVDADCCCNDSIDFDIYNIPKNKFISSAEIWLKFRKNNLDSMKIGHAHYGMNKNECVELLTTALIYDFHCLMNDEIIYLHYPKYFKDKQFQLDENDFQKLDHLATLMLNPDKNFFLLQEIWNKESIYRILTGGTIN